MSGRIRLVALLRRTRPTARLNRNWAAAGGIAVLGVSFYAGRNTIYNDAPIAAEEKSSKKKSTASSLNSEDVHLAVYAWGSNKYNTLDQANPKVDSVPYPKVLQHLSGTAFRDIALHEKHAACVDARGDVYQWGDGIFQGDAKPRLTLAGQDVTILAISNNKVFALTRSGKIFNLATEPPKDQSFESQFFLASLSVFFYPHSDTTVGVPSLQPDVKLKRGEKFVSISTGQDHLLALTSAGRTFSHPLSPHANSHGQLGVRKLQLPDPESPSCNKLIELLPDMQHDPYAKATPFARPTEPESRPPRLDESVKPCNALFEIPSLRGVDIAQAVAGGRTSFVRTKTGGRVLAWGANEYGQLGLGTTFTMPFIQIPTEIVFSRSYPSGAAVNCTDIAAGGDVAYFTLRVQDPRAPTSIFDIVACGMGQWGSLGNGMWNQWQGVPVRLKSVSGVVEYNEQTKSLEPLTPRSISVSPTGHTMLTLSTLGGVGFDLLSWGRNAEYQLGNGKRSNIAVPSPLLDVRGAVQGRTMLRQQKVNSVTDLKGKVVKKNVVVEQCAVAGWNSGLIYWRVQ